MAGQREERRIETDDRALAFEDRTFKVIVERNSRDTLPCLEGGNMATQKVLHVGAQIEAQEDLARPRQHGDKAHQLRSTGTPDFKVVKVSPVDLHLLTRQGAQAQVSFRFGAWSMASDQVPEVIRSSWVAADLVPCRTGDWRAGAGTAQGSPG